MRSVFFNGTGQARALLATVCLSLSSWSAQAQTVPRQYTASPYLVVQAGASGSMPMTLSPSGQAVGSGAVPYGSTLKLTIVDGKLVFVREALSPMVGLLWSTNGQVTVLKPLVTKADAVAMRINASGLIVGKARKSTSSSANDFAVVWRNGTSGTPTDLGAGAWSEATHVNSAGQVLGMQHITTAKDLAGQKYAKRQPFLWANGKFQALSNFPAGISNMDCVGLSDAAQIPCNGLGFDFDTNTAYLWTNGQYLPLNFPGATTTRLMGITPGGIVHGSVQLNGVYRLFIWRAGQFSLMPSDWTYIQTMTDGGQLLVYRDTGQKVPSGDAVIVVEIHSLSGDVLTLSYGQCLNLTSGGQACGTIVDMNNQGQLLVNQGYSPGAPTNSTGNVVLTPAP
jgi:hypothetical protein